MILVEVTGHGDKPPHACLAKIYVYNDDIENFKELPFLEKINRCKTFLSMDRKAAELLRDVFNEMLVATNESSEMIATPTSYVVKSLASV